ncbi:hypothetical protein GO009_05970 [Muricauda sp. TY007]|uniref:hypothetical protein n=1 Tax=Allomuricauda sp. TY007 TaxID=2683200 RepID=UPI0013BEEA5D|nr:hypothetical protein [Muricauda sp. TY007]NDV15568.1 hypothetical protein [Muricauda sp. TY007]
MTAENILPIINALPEEERERLYAMLGVRKAEVTVPPKRKPIMTDAQATEIVMGVLRNSQIRNRKKRAMKRKGDG